MQKNVASQKIELFAFDTTTGAAKTGDAANITAYVAKDHGTVTVLGDTSATEMDSTNAKGWYLFDLTQAETNADHLLFTGKSSTSNISIVGRPIETTPANFSLASIDSNGRVDVIKIAGTSQTAANIGALLTGTGAVTFASLTVSGATTLTGNVSMAAGLNVTQSTANTSAVVITGTGSGDGIRVQGGTTGNGIKSTGGATTGHGFAGIAVGSGDGMNLTGGSTGGDGLSVTGGDGDGFKAIAGSGGVPIRGDITGNLVGTVSTVTTNTDMITAAQVRSAVGLSTANLDTQLAAIAGYIDTEVGSIITLVTALPSAATIATAVWAKDLSAPATAGTAADYIKDAAAMTDQWFTMTEDDGASGYQFTALALDNVTVDTSSLVGASITLAGPVVANGGVEIIQGNDYNSTIGNALTWTFTGMPTIPSDAVVTLVANLGDTNFTKVGARVSSTSLKVEIDGTLTTATLLPVGTYRMQVDVTSATWGAGKKVSYVDAGMLVKRKV